MDTETLNEYLFADLLTVWAVAACDRRAKAKVVAEQRDQKAQLSQPLTSEDLQEGFQLLEQRRLEAVALLRESQRGGAAPTNPMEQRRTGPPPE
jgi:hypothetical protein